MPAVLSSLFSTFAEVTYGKIRDQNKYFNRPQFLMAPSPSALAQPSQFLDRSGDGRDLSDQIARRTIYTSPSPMHTTLSPRQKGQLNSHYNPPIQRRENLWNRDATDEYNPPTHAVPLDTRHEVSFPPPPSLADIQRMEPHLSPRAAVMRAGDISDGSLLSRELIRTYGFRHAEPCESPRSLRTGMEQSPSPVESQTLYYSPSNFADTELNHSAFVDGYSSGTDMEEPYDPDEEAIKTKNLAFARWASEYLYAFSTDGGSGFPRFIILGFVYQSD
jgi:hypothetical protein